MVAVSRFVEFSATGQTFATGVNSGDSGSVIAKGSRGFSRGTGLSSGDDSFTITLNSNDQLAVNINGIGNETITLTSGTDLDPRFVARDIAFKLHSANSDDAFKFAQCEWRNGFGPISNPGTNDQNSFIIWTGELGNNTGANDVNITSPGSRDARSTLGFDTVDENVGVAFATDFGSSTYTGAITVSGAYGGQFDDLYTLQISDGELVGNAVPNGGNTYNGTATTDGTYIGAADDTYTITIDTTNGFTMGMGSGNVPTFTVTDSPGTDDNANPIELLYFDHYYDVGNLGARIKFSDAVFGNGDFFTVNAFTASGTGYPLAVGAARYIWSSSNGDSSKSIGIGATTTQTTGTQVGTKGVTAAFSNSGTLSLGERFNIICRGPQTVDSNVTQLNFGNVTVSTNSSVKVVWFELISGAVSMSTVKFSLQSDGTFQHHDQGDADTEFHFGSSGAGNSAPGGGPTTNSQVDFSVDTDGLGNIDATDIDSDIPPSNLFVTKADLAVVNSADNAESIGNFQSAVVSDFIYLAIKLGANETGANSTINYRMFFDFS
jgi:hypothetical protein